MDHTLLRQFFLGITSSIMLCSSLFAQDKNPLWIRQTAISPDGEIIAFTYKGDIFTVPVKGGRATQITSNKAYDAHPVWSPDGQTLAFSSDRDGVRDVYITSREGGKVSRLSYINSKSQYPVAFLDNETIIYDCNIRPEVNMGNFPYPDFSQLYRQHIKGGRPYLYTAVTMKEPSIGADGRILYTDLKGYEDLYRKHHQSPIARDIWLYTPDTKGGVGTYQKLTTFKGEDRNALWLPGQKGYIYISEEDGSFNIYRQELNSSDKAVQLTHFQKHPVRNVSMDKNGNLAFSWDGQLYYLPLNGTPHKLDIEIIADNSRNPIEYITITDEITSADISPSEKEVVFVTRGEVFVASAKYGTTKRITNTGAQERDASFSPDGKKIVYAAEREGQWNIYLSELVHPEENLFTYASEVKERQLTDNNLPSQQPLFSPDGKKIAFLRDRTALFVYDLEKEKEYQVLDKKFNYSYMDGDQSFSWSPDSRWLLSGYIGVGGWNNCDIALVNAEGTGEVIDLTESGYNESSATFALGGKAVIFASDRKGFRSHGSWGSESDLFMMFLDQEAYDKYRLSEEEQELLNKEEEAAEEEKKKEKEKEGVADITFDENALTFDFKNRDRRTVLLTRTSGEQSGYVMDDDGQCFYYLATFDGETGLYSYDLVKKTTTQILSDVENGVLKLGEKSGDIYLISESGIAKLEGGDLTPITFKARLETNRPEERAYIFDHMVKQVENKFYDPSLHGVDWAGYAEHYRKFLPYINNNRDFQILLSELLGELNASHTGASYNGAWTEQPTGSLGLFYDDTYIGEGVKVKEVMSGGPLDKAHTSVKPGAIILKINGRTIAADKPIEYYLNGLASKQVRLLVKDVNGKEIEETHRTIHIASEYSLLYERWVEQRRQMTEKWSNGKIGYVHIEGMDSESYRRIYKELLGKYRNCDAVVVDTRFNGGGWLHNDVALLLSGKEYARFTPRGQYIGSEPFMQWYKPSAMLVSEGNYSDAYGTPWTYKELKIGKLFGTPVAGTMTAVWWETQIDPSIVFGIPQVTVQDLKGTVLENHELQPDITVYNSPVDNLKNEDRQLHAAVNDLLREIKK